MGLFRASGFRVQGLGVQGFGIFTHTKHYSKTQRVWMEKSNGVNKLILGTRNAGVD